jgi:hypothetical protein
VARGLAVRVRHLNDLERECLTRFCMLLDETYPLYLECGRQLSPHLFSEPRLAKPEDERTRDFPGRVSAEVVLVWPPALLSAAAAEGESGAPR